VDGEKWGLGKREILLLLDLWADRLIKKRRGKRSRGSAEEAQSRENTRSKNPKSRGGIEITLRAGYQLPVGRFPRPATAER